MPQKGDKVQTWSSSNKKWLEGTVEDVLTEAYSSGGLTMPKGSVRIRVSTGLRYVKPENVVSLKLALYVMVVAPGAGTGLNGEVYKELGEDVQTRVEMCGSRGANYDRYPECWQNGKPAPNLETFAKELLGKPLGDVLVLGSRGGQVVLPRFWRKLGDQVPPAVVINGGCAMNLPGPKIAWPQQAVTMMLMGAEDFFKGKKSSAEYLTASKSYVPPNSRTAILYVRQMQHMPQKALLQLVLRPLVMAAARWKYSKTCPEEQLHQLTVQLEDESWSGSLFILQGSVWKESTFGPLDESPKKKSKTAETEAEESALDTVQVTRRAELRSLFRAAVVDVTPKGGSGFLRARTTSKAMRQTLTESTNASEGRLEAARELRQLAKLEAQRVAEIEANIAQKEKELLEMREQVAKARKEELRLIKMAEAHEVATNDEAHPIPDSPVLSPQDDDSPKVQPLGARILVPGLGH